jgi:hypothetical protein
MAGSFKTAIDANLSPPPPPARAYARKADRRRDIGARRPGMLFYFVLSAIYPCKPAGIQDSQVNNARPSVMFASLMSLDVMVHALVYIYG